MSKRFYVRPDLFGKDKLDAAKDFVRKLSLTIEQVEAGNNQGVYYLNQFIGEDQATEEWLNQKISDDDRTLRHSFNPDFV